MTIKSSNKITISEQKKIIKIIEWYLASDKKSGVVNKGPDRDPNWKQNFEDIQLNSVNKYLWNYEETIYSLGEPDITDPVIIGTHETGGDGRTTYFHIKYSDFPNPTDDQMTETPSKYIGTYTDFVQADSEFAARYTWARFQGEDGKNGNNGENGVGIKTSVVEYVVSNQGNTAPETGWSTVIPDIKEGQYLWTRTTIEYTNQETSIIYSVSKNGTDGADGSNGNTSYVHIKYSNDGGKSFTPERPDAPAGETPGDYIGQYTDFIEKDSELPSDYKWSLLKGTDGKGVSSTTITYAKSTSGTEPPKSGWDNKIPDLVPGEYLWTRTVIQFTDNTSSTSYSVSKNGNDGTNGTDGADGNTSYIHIKYSNYPKPNDDQMLEEPAEYIGTYTDFIEEDSLIATDYKWSKFQGKDGTNGTNGTDGVGVKEAIISYGISSSGDVVPDSWSPTIPEIPEGQYLWTRTILKYTNNDESDPSYSVSRNGFNGENGANGTDGKSSYIHIKYSDDGGNTFTSNDGEIPGKYIGQYTDFDPTDSKNVGDYTWSLIKGSDGTNGVGVKSTTVQYKVDSQGSIPPKTGWQNDFPNVPEGQYLWTKTEIVYTENLNPSTSYSVSKNGSNGLDGSNGENGKTSYIHIKYSAYPTPTDDQMSEEPLEYIGTYTDFIEEDSTVAKDYKWSKFQGSNGSNGVGVETATVTYGTSESGKVPPSDWEADIPVVPEGQYLWTKTILKYTNGDFSDPSYSVSRNGFNGKDGTSGADGLDGKTSYIHIKYSNDGGLSFTPGDSETPEGETPGSYIGQYTDFEINDSTNVKDYKWSLIKGSDGANGDNGIGVKSATVQYKLDTQGLTPPSSGWQNDFPDVQEGQYLWTKTEIIYTEKLEPSISYSVSKNGTNGNDGTNGETSYIHIKYSAYPNPTNEQMTEEPSEYIGTYTDFNKEDSLIAKDYKWAKFQGKDGINGNDGVGVKEAIITYGISDSGDIKPTEWNSEIPIVPEGKYLWTKTVLKYTNNDFSNPSYSVSRNGFNGKDGTDGSNGTNGETSYIHIKYSNDGGNNFTDNEGETPGDYIGQYTDFNSTDSKNPGDYKWSLIKGSNGSNGSDGIGVKSTKVQYKVDSQGTTPPVSGWVDNFPDVPEGKYLWTKTEIIYTEKLDPSVSYSVSKNGTNGSDGSNGSDGKTSYIHIKYSSYPNPTNEQMTETPSEYIGTYTDFNPDDSLIAKDYKWSKFQGTDGTNGSDGVGVKKAVIDYAVSNDGQNPPVSGWQSTIPQIVDGQYLWTRTVLIYTNDDESDPSYSVGKNGTNGSNGSDGADGDTSYIHIKYSNDKGVTFTGNDGEDVGLYIGQYTDFIEADSMDPKDYKWALIKGSDGTNGTNGVGISNVINYYCLTKTTILPENPDWKEQAGTMTPTLKYLWNYEKIVYTDKSYKNTDPAIIGVYGDSGSDAEAIDFQIYSTDGFEFSDEIVEITLKTTAFKNGTSITNGTYQWEFFDKSSDKYIPIQGKTSNSLIVNKTDDYSLASLRCVLTYGGKKYQDTVSLTVKTEVYTSLVKFFDGSNIFNQEKPYLAAYVELYKNNVLLETVTTSQYYYGEVTFSGLTINSDIEGSFKLYDYMYFIYPSNGDIKYVLGKYNGSNWIKQEIENTYFYKNDLYPDNHTNIIVISKEDITKSKEINISIYKKELDASGNQDLSNDARISVTAMTIIDTNDPIVSNEEPKNVKEGQLWLDTSTNPSVLKVYEKTKIRKVEKVAESGINIWGATEENTKIEIFYSEKVYKNSNGNIRLENPISVELTYNDVDKANCLVGKYVKHYNKNYETIYFIDVNGKCKKQWDDPYYHLTFGKQWRVTGITETESIAWVKCDQQGGGAVYTSRPTSYKEGDLWIIATGETCGVYGEGTMLKALQTSDHFDESHWTDNMSSLTGVITNVKESFIWDSTGIKILRKVTDKDGNEKTPFYVKIDSTRMGFHSVEYLQNGNVEDVEVVHVGNNSSIIRNATFEGDRSTGTEFKTPTTFTQQINIKNSNGGFIWKIEENGSLSLAII